MPKKRETGGASSASNFLGIVFKFFSAVKTDTVLSVLWGVEVLLFAILSFMVLFGNLTADQRFTLALVIIASVVLTFVFTAWRLQRPDSDVTPEPAAHGELIAQAHQCLTLLTQIQEANARTIRRGNSGSGPWGQILNDTYNNVCKICHERRGASHSPDAYFDVICAEADVRTVCDSKWQLGELLDDYRIRLNRLSWPPKEHDDLERLIRRSITQPDLSPRDLESAARHVIDIAKRVR
jgi:hypothetical protein